MASGGSLTTSTAVLLFVLKYGPVTSDLVDLFRTACPYSNFCTVNSSIESTSVYESCCLDCFCDEDCRLFGDCCPDFEQSGKRNKETATPLECKPLAVDNDFFLNKGSNLFDVPSYRIIDFCPVDNSIEKCIGSADEVPDFDEMVVVSDRKSGVPYKNKYCAECHGVTDTIRWELMAIYCQESLMEAHLMASQVNHYLFENCLLTSIPVNGVPVNGRSLDCQYYPECEEGNAARELVDGCTNGPIMPYHDAASRAAYKNVLCYQCRKGRDARHDCHRSDLDRDEMKTSAMASFSFLLNVFEHTHDPPATRQAKHPCGDNEQFDPFTNQCRHLYCPPFEAMLNGDCIQIASPIAGVQVKLLFVPTYDAVYDVLLDIQVYNKSIAVRYATSINRKLGNKHCELTQFYVNILFDADSRTVGYVLVYLFYKINDKCQIQTLRDMLQTQMHLNEKWLLNDGQSIETKGKVTFFNIYDFGFRKTLKYDYAVLYETIYVLTTF